MRSGACSTADLGVAARTAPLAPSHTPRSLGREAKRASTSFSPSARAWAELPARATSRWAQEGKKIQPSPLSQKAGTPAAGLPTCCEGEGEGGGGGSVQLCAQLVPGAGSGCAAQRPGGQGARRSRPRGGAGCGEERSGEGVDSRPRVAFVLGATAPSVPGKVSLELSAVRTRKLRLGTWRADLEGPKVVGRCHQG